MPKIEKKGIEKMDCLFEFSATSGYLRGKTTANVKVYRDQITIHRDTKLANIPRELILSFADISSITYDENRSNVWISFAVTGVLPNSQMQRAQPVYAMRPGEIVITPNIKMAPFGEPYAIIFQKAQKDEAKTCYRRLLELHKEARNQAKPISTVCSESALDKLKKLKVLSDLGILSGHEYEEKRKELLQQI